MKRAFITGLSITALCLAGVAADAQVSGSASGTTLTPDPNTRSASGQVGAGANISAGSNLGLSARAGSDMGARADLGNRGPTGNDALSSPDRGQGGIAAQSNTTLGQRAPVNADPRAPGTVAVPTSPPIGSDANRSTVEGSLALPRASGSIGVAPSPGVSVNINTPGAVAVPGVIAGTQHQANFGAAVPATNENWRMTFHGGRWWYWLPENRWVYWNGSAWLDFVPGSTVITEAAPVYTDNYVASYPSYGYSYPSSYGYSSGYWGRPYGSYYGGYGGYGRGWGYGHGHGGWGHGGYGHGGWGHGHGGSGVSIGFGGGRGGLSIGF